MILIFDTETSGFPKKDCALNHPDQPHLVQLGMRLAGDDGKSSLEMKTLIQPEPGFDKMPESAKEAHGISIEDCREGGIPLVNVMKIFFNAVVLADKLVAHNIEFDTKIMEIARQRMEMPSFPDRIQICTMKASTPLCKLPNKFRRNSYKWPKLQEAHKHFFGEEFASAHDAMADVKACERVYFHLVKEGAL